MHENLERHRLHQFARSEAILFHGALSLVLGFVLKPKAQTQYPTPPIGYKSDLPSHSSGINAHFEATLTSVNTW